MAQSAVPVFKPTILSAKSYFEIFTVTAQHDDQTFIQMQLNITNLGVVDKNGSAKILVLHTAEKSWKGSTFCDQKNWSYSDTPNPVLSVTTCRIEQLPGKLVCTGTLDGITIHIVLEGVPGPIPTPNTTTGKTNGIRSKKETTGAIYEYEVLLPWSKAHTTLTLPGRAPKELEGFGMVEHSRSTGNPREISQGWVTFRGNQPGNYFLANFRLSPGKGAPAVGWGWKEGDSTPTAMQGLTMTSVPNTNGGPVKEIRIISALDKSFRITGGQILYRYSFIDDLGPVLGYLVQVIVCNLVTRYYDAEVQLSPASPPMKGILELMTIE